MMHTSQNRLPGNISEKMPVRTGMDGGDQDPPFVIREEVKI
jgi:hypothetical protein